jgi:hypothetical protein
VLHKKGRVKTLWHISTRENIDSIMRCGIDPAYSTGKRPCSWFVEWYGLLWALVHISLLKRVPVHGLACFRVSAAAGYFTHFNRRVWTCRKVLKPRLCLAAEYAVNKIEHQRQYNKSRL